MWCDVDVELPFSQFAKFRLLRRKCSFLHYTFTHKNSFFSKTKHDKYKWFSEMDSTINSDLERCIFSKYLKLDVFHQSPTLSNILYAVTVSKYTKIQWPSGLRRWCKVSTTSVEVVRVPLLSIFFQLIMRRCYFTKSNIHKRNHLNSVLS